MKYLMWSCSAVCLVMAGSVWAADPVEDKNPKAVEYKATVELGPIYTNGEDQSARYKDFNDMRTGLISSGEAQYFKGDYHGELKLKNILRDDQSYRYEGGQYGKSKYSVWYDSIVHKLSKQNSTYYTGVGSYNLDYRDIGVTLAAGYLSPVDPSLLTWNNFQYKTIKTKLGAKYEYSFDNPYYVNLSVNRTLNNGTKPQGTLAAIYLERLGAIGAPGMGNPIEFPEYQNDQTIDAALEGGYRTDKMYSSVTASISNFAPGATWTSIRNPALASSASYALPAAWISMSTNPPSNQVRVAAQSTIYHLPFESTLQVKASVDDTTNSIDLLSQIPFSSAGGYSMQPLTLNAPTFKGDVATLGASAIWRGVYAGFDYDMAYRFFNKANRSTSITYTNGTSVSSSQFDYKKQNLALEVERKLGAKTKLAGGYENLFVERHDRDDALTNWSQTSFLEAKNESFDLIHGKLRWTHVDRRSNFTAPTAGTDPTVDVFLNNFIRKYDVTDKTGDVAKIELTSTPRENLDVTLFGAWKYNNYYATEIGLKNDSGIDTGLDVSYEMPSVFKATVFGDLDTALRHGKHRYLGAAAGVQADPTTGVDAALYYNWEDYWNDTTIRYGTNVTVPVIKEKMDATVGWTREEARASTKFTQGAFPVVPLVNIDNMGNYTKSTITGEVAYKVSKNLTTTLTVLWEALDSDDVQYNGYTSYMANYSGANSFMYLTGAFNDNHYNAWTAYATAKYEF